MKIPPQEYLKRENATKALLLILATLGIRAKCTIYMNDIHKFLHRIKYNP